MSTRNAQAQVADEPPLTDAVLMADPQATTVAADTGPPLPMGGVGAVSRRSTAPIDVLSRRVNAVCTHAVNPLEIAATLEAHGITDAISRDEYDCEDVFVLARELYSRVPLRASQYAARRRPVQSTRTSLARGMLFALPGLFYLLVGPVFSSAVAPIVVLIAVIAGWGLSQVLAIVGYTLIGRGNRSGAGKVLGLVLIAGLAAMCAIGAIATFGTDWDRNLVAMCCTQILYVMAATVLLMFKRDDLLWMSLLPGAALSAIYLAGNPAGLSRGVAVGGVVIAMALTFGAALYASDRAFQEGPRADIWLGRSDAWTAIQFGTYGLLVATCLATPTMRAVLDHGTDTALIGLATLPLVLSMGVAEWQQVRYAERRHRAKVAAHDMDSFGLAAWRGLLVSVGTHAAALFGLSLIMAVGIIFVAGGIPWSIVGLLTAYLFLGAALFMSLLLTAWGRINSILPFLGMAVVVILVLVFATPSASEQLTEYLAASAVLTACLFALGWREVRILTNHGD